MTTIEQVPEIAALSAPPSLIRIPEQIDVPVTPRVMRLIDTPAFQRLKSVSQLGFVAWVYPGATHNRFEHSLGVYRLALHFVRRLASDEAFRANITPQDIELLLVSALLHDIAHWPFCHPIEDIRLPEVPHHETLAIAQLQTREIAQALEEDWQLKPEDVQNLLTKNVKSTSHKILSSILSGPIDVDKMDYLYRDSLHAGVPYGRNFDSQRLIASLCLNQNGDRLAISSKGKTAAELMVFARYVMFSEVYWHHAVRSATAMFQRAFFMLREELQEADLSSLFKCRENEIVGVMKVLDRNRIAAPLIDGLFGTERALYKRWDQFAFTENAELYAKIAGKPYQQLVEITDRISQTLTNQWGKPIQSHEILLDAPPIGLEVQFDVDVIEAKHAISRKLGAVSPVVKTLASSQFDNYVKQIRLFVHPRIAQDAQNLNAVEILDECAGN